MKGSDILFKPGIAAGSPVGVNVISIWVLGTRQFMIGKFSVFIPSNWSLRRESSIWKELVQSLGPLALQATALTSRPPRAWKLRKLKITNKETSCALRQYLCFFLILKARTIYQTSHKAMLQFSSSSSLFSSDFLFGFGSSGETETGSLLAVLRPLLPRLHRRAAAGRRQRRRFRRPHQLPRSAHHPHLVAQSPRNLRPHW